MVPHPSCTIPEAGGLYNTVYTARTGHTWWPNTRLSDFTLVFPFFLSTNYTLQALMLKQKLLYFSHIMHAENESLEKSTMLGVVEGGGGGGAG